jgi:secreted PhoX family phosphatase
MVSVEYEGKACVDCLMVIANGDLSGMTDKQRVEWETAVENNDPTFGGRLQVVVTGNPDDEDGSSYFLNHGRCDYCGRTQGGDFHPIAFLA